MFFAAVAASAVAAAAMGVSEASSAATCYSTGFVRDGIDLTAAQIGGTANGTIDATGCNIGVYIDSVHTGSVTEADIFGANYFGVLVNGTSSAVTDSLVHNIGEVPLNGAQHGNAIVFLGGASGTIGYNEVYSYQKNGITVSGAGTSASVLHNIVSGEGPITYIAQNGIQISFGGTALVRGNTVSDNWYTPEGTEACGLLLYQASGVKTQMNNLFDNEVNFCNFGRGGGHTSA
jgi:Right handed beta helix region